MGYTELDAWIKKHEPDLSKPEAIRRGAGEPLLLTPKGEAAN